MSNQSFSEFVKKKGKDPKRTIVYDGEVKKEIKEEVKKTDQ